MLSEALSSGELPLSACTKKQLREATRLTEVAAVPERSPHPHSGRKLVETLGWVCWNEPTAISIANMGTDDSGAAFLLILHPPDNCKTPKLSVVQHDE